MNDIKVIIPLATSHIQQFRLNVDFIKQNNSNFSVIAPTDTIALLKRDFPDVDYINENDLGIDISLIKQFFMDNAKSTKRMGWYLQQFVKFNYSNYCNGDYISIDSDTIQLKPIQFKTDDGKYIFNLKDEHNIPYFDTIHWFFPNYKFAEKSFISEYMIFNSNIMKELIEKFKVDTSIPWYINILQNVGHNHYGLEKCLNGCGFSEFETYGTYMLNNYPDKICFCNLNTCRYGRSLFGHIPTKDEILSRNLQYDTISFENW